jgi:hypothetical protein
VPGERLCLGRGIGGNEHCLGPICGKGDEVGRGTLGGNADDVEAQPLRNLERLATDRAGGPEDDERLQVISPVAL